eukprot:6458717-Amphidinium_carterae.1
MGVVAYDLYQLWGREIAKALRRVAPEAMRSPTLNEARLFDRLVHEQILPHVARGDGSLEAGLRFYLNDGRTHSYWNLLEFQPAGTPDKGVERSLKRPRDVAAARPTAPAVSGQTTLCFVCGLPRDAHPNRRFCSGKSGKPSPKGKGNSKGKSRKPAAAPPAPPAALASTAAPPASS